MPFSSVGGDDAAGAPAVDLDRFTGPESSEPGRWRSVPPRLDALPEHRLLGAETRDVIARAIAALPTPQRAIITLRDVEGWEAVEACEALGVSEGHQRVLLHRARSRVRRALERHLTAEGAP